MVKSCEQRLFVQGKTEFTHSKLCNWVLMIQIVWQILPPISLSLFLYLAPSHVFAFTLFWLCPKSLFEFRTFLTSTSSSAHWTFTDYWDWQWRAHYLLHVALEKPKRCRSLAEQNSFVAWIFNGFQIPKNQQKICYKPFIDWCSTKNVLKKNVALNRNVCLQWK